MKSGNPIKISAVIITLNEADNLEKCLKSLAGVADELIVVDSYSTDATVEIAASFGARVFKRNFDGYGSQKNWGIEHASFNFILSLDADEVLSDQLIQSILKIKNNCSDRAFSLKRKNFFMGKWMRHCGWYPDRQIRLWDKRVGVWNSKTVHEGLALEKSVTTYRLKGDILHHSHTTLVEHLLTIDEYSRLRAEARVEAGESYSLLPSLLKTFFRFFNMYFLKLGFLDGKAGLVICINSAHRHIIEHSHYKRGINLRSPGTRICFFNTTDSWGGGEKWHFETAKGLLQHGHEIFFIASKKSVLAEKLREACLPTLHLKTRNLSYLDVFMLIRIGRFFYKNKIKAVVINGSSDMKAGVLAAFFAGVPNVIYRRGLAKSPKGNLPNHLFFVLGITHFIVNSRDTGNYLFAGMKVKPGELKVKLLYNGIVPHLAQATVHGRNGKIILGNASRLVEQKGHDLMILVAEELERRAADFLIRIAGTGQLEVSLRQMVIQKKLEHRVEFLDFVEDIGPFVEGMDVYLCTSRFEGFGYSMVEAMYAGKPVVAFDVSSNPELIEDGKTGFLVEAFDIEAFAERTARLIADAELRRTFGEAAREIAEERFSLDKQIHDFEEYIFEEVMSG